MAEMRPQLPHRAVEAGGIAVRARLHHAALHGRLREFGEFAARFTGADEEVALERPRHPQEFDRWRWAGIDELVGLIVPFKRAALHGRRRELGEFAAVETFGQAQVCLKQALFHSVNPGIELPASALSTGGSGS